MAPTARAPAVTAHLRCKRRVVRWEWALETAHCERMAEEREGGGKRGKAASIPHFLMPLRTTVLYNVHSRQPRRPEPLLCWCCSRGTHAYHGEGGRQPAGAIATRALRPRLSGGGRSGVFWLPLNCPRRVKSRVITSTHLVRLRVMPVDTACHNPRKTGYIWCEQAACIQSFFVLSHRLCGG